MTQLIWEDLSRGFHGGYFDSNEICTFDEDGEKQLICFSVREYTSDRTDFFGVECPAWELILFIREIRNGEYSCESKWLIGKDYGRAEYAKEFADYVVESVKKHGNISRLPFSELLED